jgi:hypothetical protein
MVEGDERRHDVDAGCCFKEGLRRRVSKERRDEENGKAGKWGRWRERAYSQSRSSDLLVNRRPTSFVISPVNYPRYHRDTKCSI